MSKTLYGYTIGANIQEQEAARGVQVVPDNKTMIALPFNDDPDSEVDPVRLKSMKEIFTQYKPQTEVELKDLEGDKTEVTLTFNSLKDFSMEGIIEQSPLLQKLEQQEEVYAKFANVLQTNEKLRDVLANPESKKELIELLGLLIEELNA